VEITDLAATAVGMVLVSTLEETVASVATMENQVLEGIRVGMDLVATMVELVLEIVEAETALLGAQIAGEVALVLEIV
jgi:hypothetical protein